MNSQNGYIAAKDKLQGGNQAKRKDSLDRYSAKPKRCLDCDAIIPYEKRFGSKFCSQSCSARYNNQRRQSKKKGVVCLQCGVSLVGKKSHKFCSLVCFSEYKYREYIRKWLVGEIAGDIKTDQSPKSIRRWLFDKNDSRCQVCGWNQKNKTTGLVPLQVHHTDGNCRNNRPENLMLLCPNCHSLTPTHGSLNNGNGRNARRAKRNEKLAGV